MSAQETILVDLPTFTYQLKECLGKVVRKPQANLQFVHPVMNFPSLLHWIKCLSGEEIHLSDPFEDQLFGEFQVTENLWEKKFASASELQGLLGDCFHRWDQGDQGRSLMMLPCVGNKRDPITIVAQYREINSYCYSVNNEVSDNTELSLNPDEGTASKSRMYCLLVHLPLAHSKRCSGRGDILDIYAGAASQPK